jgi:hypothetical protein
MPTLTINYVAYTGIGPHTRQPRAIGQYGGFAPIGNLSGAVGNVSEGSTFQLTPGLMQSPLIAGNLTYSFGFVNISGGTGGGQTSVKHTQPLSVTVGTAPILVMVVYVAQEGSGSGASIDAFDESTGSLVDDTFVTVSPDANGALTTSGNTEGWVVTTNTETIAAHAHITPTNADFDKWVVLESNNLPPAGVNLKVNGGTSVIALAVYKDTPAEPQEEIGCQDMLQSIDASISGPPHGPKLTITQWKAVVKQLGVCRSKGFITLAQYNSAINKIKAAVPAAFAP